MIALASHPTMLDPGAWQGINNKSNSLAARQLDDNHHCPELCEWQTLSLARLWKRQRRLVACQFASKQTSTCAACGRWRRAPDVPASSMPLHQPLIRLIGTCTSSLHTTAFGDELVVAGSTTRHAPALHCEQCDNNPNFHDRWLCRDIAQLCWLQAAKPPPVQCCWAAHLSRGDVHRVCSHRVQP